MPIISIIEQPSANDLKAAYRPVIFKVNATRTDGNLLPPIVFCDIYVNGIFYKSAPKTQYSVLNATDSTWQFDIMDACQEVLKAFLATNGGSSIVAAATVMAQIYCKFRSSGINTDGFLVAEGTAPVQGTGTIDPVAGTGTQSNSFYVANSVLQHDQNQSLSAHLNYFKSGTWDASVFPLSHRPNGYKICNGDSDFFPVINLSAEDFKCMVLHFKKKGDTLFSAQTYCPSSTCIPVAVPSFTLSDATANSSYIKTVTISGTQPFSLFNTVSPTWLHISVSGSIITFSGTPADGDLTDGATVSFDIVNDCGMLSVSKTIKVVATACTNVSVVGTPIFPNTVAGAAYSYSFNVAGTSPFAIGAVTKPAWMTFSISGNTVTASGTAGSAQNNVSVSVEITNCSSGSATVANTININPAGAQISGANTPTTDDSCTTIYDLGVTANIDDSLTISAAVVNGYGTIEPSSPVTISYTSPLSYEETLLNANGQGFSRIVFTVVNNTTGVTTSVTLTRNNNSIPC